MVYTENVQKAVHFSIEIHEEIQKQKRKGKDIPYITHPLTVGLILAKAGASEKIIIAGLLHDTIEDRPLENRVTKDILLKKFGVEIAELVDSVSEKNQTLSWHERKEAALLEIKTFSHDSLFLKSGDVISNSTELIRDYEKDGEATFARFNATKEEALSHTLRVIRTILDAWPENPLQQDLLKIEETLQLLR